MRLKEIATIGLAFLIAGCWTYEDRVKNKAKKKYGFSEAETEVVKVAADRLLFTKETPGGREFSYGGINIYDVGRVVNGELKGINYYLGVVDENVKRPRLPEFYLDLIEHDMKREKKRWTWASRRINKKIIRMELERFLYGEDAAPGDNFYVAYGEGNPLNYDLSVLIPSKYLRNGEELMDVEPEEIKVMRRKGLLNREKAVKDSAKVMERKLYLLSWDVDKDGMNDFAEVYRKGEDRPFLWAINSRKEGGKVALLFDYDLKGSEDYGSFDDMYVLEGGGDNLNANNIKFILPYLLKLADENTLYLDENGDVFISGRRVRGKGPLYFTRFMEQEDEWITGSKKMEDIKGLVKNKGRVDEVYVCFDGEKIEWVARVYSGKQGVFEYYRVRESFNHDIAEIEFTGSEAKKEGIAGANVSSVSESKGERKIKSLPGQFSPAPRISWKRRVKYTLFDKTTGKLKESEIDENVGILGIFFGLFEREKPILIKYRSGAEKRVSLEEMLKDDPFRIDFTDARVEEGKVGGILKLEHVTVSPHETISVKTGSNLPKRRYVFLNGDEDGTFERYLEINGEENPNPIDEFMAVGP